MHILRVGFSFSFKFGLKWALKLYPKDIAKWDQNFMTHRSGPHAKPLPKFQPNRKCNYFIIITTNFQPYTLSEVFIKSRIGFCKWNFTSIQLSIFRWCTKIGKFYTYLFAGHLFSIYFPHAQIDVPTNSAQKFSKLFFVLPTMLVAHLNFYGIFSAPKGHFFHLSIWQVAFCQFQNSGKTKHAHPRILPGSFSYHAWHRKNIDMSFWAYIVYTSFS